MSKPIRPSGLPTGLAQPIPSLPWGAASPAASPSDAASVAGAQGDTLLLARILGRLVTALEPLLRDAPQTPEGRHAWAHVPTEALTAARDELKRVRDELAPLQGAGDALLSVGGRFAKSQQRADPLRAEHFGG